MSKSAFRKLIYKIALPVVLILPVVTGCAGNRIERQTGAPEAVIAQHPAGSTPYLKLHMQNGDLYLMKNWNIDSNNIIGSGLLYDYNRTLLKMDTFAIPVKDVVLAETNSIGGAPGTLTMIIPTIAAGIMGIVCMTNPKACFGSCPTFYTNDGTDYHIRAEGFSSSVSPCLEEKDIDVLYGYRAEGNNLEIQLRNEAYETHFIRKINILALPRHRQNKVLAAEDGQFFEVNHFKNPWSITGEEGDCSQKLCSIDGEERFSLADSNNLAEKEFIDVTFYNVPEGRKGIVIASRQTLLMTYIFYQGLAYMGNSAGDYYAKLERDTSVWKNIMRNTRNELGRIEVYLNNNNSWQKIGETGEYGPIASDIKIIPFDGVAKTAPLRVRLRMTKGFWRIDYLSLADIIGTVVPIRISPSESYPEKDRKGSDIVALLNNDDSLLVTIPGDKYFLHYNLPQDTDDYDLFLESQGYYIEWMRKEWMKEENPAMVYRMFFNTRQYFKDIAPQFKEIESEMEESFWSSKYVNP